MKKIIYFLLALPCFLNAQYVGTGSVSQGLATTVSTDIFPGCAGSRVSGVGSITSTDGHVWTVPAVTQFTTGTALPDLYNQCSGVTPASIAGVNLATVPTTVIDASGAVITAYLFGDNYYELYINGVLVGVDPVPYTPFNSSIVKFKVLYPYTIAVKLVDWEENLGVGTELNAGNPYHSGDGGFIASFSDGTVTDASWKAQTFYIAPVQDLTTIVELADSTRSSATALTATTCNGSCYAIHYAVPSAWKNVGFNDAVWPTATLYAPATVGVSSILAYTNFISTWSTAQFIWSSNLILDNEVLVRKTVTAPAGVSENKIVDAAIAIFPNPTNNEFQLHFDGTYQASDVQNISIYNLIGEKVFETTTYIDKIAIEKFPAGVYSVKISFEKFQTTKKLIVQ
jgi:Secretion system C-terminal sorting domain